MRISTTRSFVRHREDVCGVLEDCERAYCKPHRLLYMVCETAQRDIGGDIDADAGAWDCYDVTGDCPRCLLDHRKATQGPALALLAALFFMAPAVHAWEKRGNPDRFPSIGVELAKGQVAGIPRAGINGAQSSGGTVGFAADFRFPATQNLTLHAELRHDGIDNNLAYTDGYRAALGFRVYIRD